MGFLSVAEGCDVTFNKHSLLAFKCYVYVSGECRIANYTVPLRQSDIVDQTIDHKIQP